METEVFFFCKIENYHKFSFSLPMRYGLSGASLATFGDKILISGGVGVGGILKAVKRLLVYDIRTNEWLKGPSMNQVSFFSVKSKQVKQSLKLK